MALSPGVLTELRGELETLHRMRVQIDERTKAIEALLAPLDLGQVTLPFASIPANNNGHGLDAKPAVVTVSPGGSAFANTGLRDAIRAVLAKRGPMRAPDVARELVARGFKDASQTPIATRVYNDMWRMEGSGILERRGKGVFAVRP
jgi:hypothetical protein